MKRLMDICLIKTKEGTQIKTTSIHGMLWLQTHFEAEHWNSLADNNVKISTSDSRELGIDAQEAGLTVNEFPVISARRINL